MTQLRELIGLMGRKRFMILCVALIITAAMGYVWQYYLMPKNEALNLQKNNAESALRSLQSEVEGLPDKYAELTRKEEQYIVLNDKGFVANQDRIDARERLDELRVASGLRGIQYNISPQIIVEHPNDYALAHHIVSSDMSFELKGLTDLEMRDFIKKMTDDFSGLVVLTSMEFNREAELNSTNLTMLSNKTPVDFVSGKAAFVWYSLIEKTNNEATLQEQAFGGISQ